MSFQPQVLIQKAVRATGISDFGSEPFLDGLNALCCALNEEAALNPAGRVSAENAIVGTLSERLRIEDWCRRRPEILQQSAMPMVFVVGLPRTGTTALSQFLSEDPAARSIRRWELFTPTPPPDVQTIDDPRIAATRAAFAARDEALPQFKSMLPVEAEDPSEHGPLLAYTFRNLHFPSLYNVPSYFEWLKGADMSGAFGYMAKVLKLLQWKTPGRYWNLKNPPDVGVLDAIKATFPNCMFVWTHRDPALSMSSLGSLIAMLRGQTTDAVDKPALMRSLLEFQAEMIRRGLATRERLGDGSFVDVSQQDLGRDTIGVIRDLYARIGLRFTGEYEAHLRHRMQHRPRGAHGKHEHAISDFGVSADQVRERFVEYMSRFNIVSAV